MLGYQNVSNIASIQASYITFYQYKKCAKECITNMHGFMGSRFLWFLSLLE